MLAFLLVTCNSTTEVVNSSTIMITFIVIYYSCVKGTLVEINDGLVKNPDLLYNAVGV